MYKWNLWHGCKKYSEGCLNCYVYRIDEHFKRDPTIISKTKDFDLPIKKDRYKNYKIPSNSFVYTCFSSDFFLEDADIWRNDAWDIIRQRPDLTFFIITKRVERIKDNLPSDFNNFNNVIIYITVESQKQADIRLPIYNSLPLKHKGIVCEPILEEIDLSNYLSSDIKEVIVGGESGDNARICDYRWVLSLKKQCDDKNIAFRFKQTGAKFLKDNVLYNIKRKDQEEQASKSGLNISSM